MTAPNQRIAVLGAGPMGLAVAYQLARDGHRPVVFEADDRVGGMTACLAAHVAMVAMHLVALGRNAA